MELSREEKVWQIQEAVVTLDPAIMLRKLTELIEVTRAEFVPLSWAVMDLMRKIHTTAQMLKQGETLGSIYGKARLWGETGNRIMNIARTTPVATIAQLLHTAVETDRACKFGQGDQTRNLEALLVTIADRCES